MKFRSRGKHFSSHFVKSNLFPPTTYSFSKELKVGEGETEILAFAEPDLTQA